MNGLRRSSWIAVAAVILLSVATGCQSAGPRRTASAEPGMTTASPALGAPVEGGTAAADAKPPASVSWTDRHPLFARPKYYYDSTQSNKVVKVGVATVVGVPAGIFGEIKQIVVGAPPDAKY